MDFKTIIAYVLNYFWEIFKYWGIIPEDFAAEVEEKLPSLDLEF